MRRPSTRDLTPLLFIALACGSSGGGGAAQGGAGGGSRSCPGSCTAGDTCTLDPPGGSDAPSISCICTAEGTWCCDVQTCYQMLVGGGGAATGGGSSGGTAVTAGTTNGGTSTAGTGAAPSGGASSGCPYDCALDALTCCNGLCVNPANDINNCGQCGVTCSGPNPYCNYGTCGSPPCNDSACPSKNCCGTVCCGVGQLCCDISLGAVVTGCHDPVNGTCPVGCPSCDCASADTLVATPNGDVPIHTIHRGDVVFSVSGSAIVPAVVVQTNRVAVSNHVMVRAELEGGAAVYMSPRHPTAEGRRFRELTVGDSLGDLRIVAIDVVPYPHAFTYDILPATESGAYFADGALVGSTLKP